MLEYFLLFYLFSSHLFLFLCVLSPALAVDFFFLPVHNGELRIASCGKSHVDVAKDGRTVRKMSLEFQKTSRSKLTLLPR